MAHANLLRVSGLNEGAEVDVRVANGTAADPSGGVEHGEVLRAFAQAILVDRESVDEARQACVDALGAEGAAHAAAIVAAFDGINRVADGTGIRLDAGMQEAGGREVAETLELEERSA